MLKGVTNRNEMILRFGERTFQCQLKKLNVRRAAEENVGIANYVVVKKAASVSDTKGGQNGKVAESVRTDDRESSGKKFA